MILRATALGILLSAVWLAAGCSVLRPLPGPAEEEPLPPPEALSDSLETYRQRLADAGAAADSGSVENAALRLRELFMELDTLVLPYREFELQQLRLEAARLLVRLMPEAPADSAETEGIHSLDFTLGQVADSVQADTLLAELLEPVQQDLLPDSPELDSLALLPAEDRAETPARELLPGIPRAEEQRIRGMVEYFTEGRGRKYYQIWLERYPSAAPTIRRILREEGLPQDLVYLPMIESGFKRTARSRARAVGPWQFMAGTARVFDLRVDYWVDERRDLDKSSRAAARFLRNLYERYEDWYLALAAYNWGPGRVDRAIKRAGGRKDYWRLPRMPAETRNYVPTLLAAREVFERAADYGFEIESGDADSAAEGAVFSEVKVRGALNLKRLADMLEVEESRLKAWNPQLRRFCTPPDGGLLRVPEERAAELRAELAALPDDVYRDWLRHKVRRGDTLSGIASRYGVSLSQVLKGNQLSRRSIIRPGQNILVPLPKGSGTAATRASTTRREAPSSDGLPVYVVRRGDALERIARHEDLSLSDLLRWNAISRKDRIYPGQRLLLADPAEAEEGTSAGSSSAKPLQSMLHVVRRGETAGGIAQRYGVPLADLVRLNKLNRRATIYTGQKLRIPDGAGKRPLPEVERLRTVHVVQRGDTLWDLARQYKVRVSDIRRWNSLNGSSRIYPGSRLVIYLKDKG